MLSLSIRHHLQIIPWFLFTSSHIPPKVLSGCFVKKLPFYLRPKKTSEFMAKYCALVRGKDTRHIMGSGYLETDLCRENIFHGSSVIRETPCPCIPGPTPGVLSWAFCKWSAKLRGLSIRSPNPSSCSHGKTLNSKAPGLWNQQDLAQALNLTFVGGAFGNLYIH